MQSGSNWPRNPTSVSASCGAHAFTLVADVDRSGSEHPADHAAHAEAVLREGATRREGEHQEQQERRRRQRVGASAPPTAPPVGAPYLADLDGALLKFGTTPGDARRTFKFYLRMEQEVCRPPPTVVAAATHARKAPQPHAATAIVGNHLSTALPLHRASP